MFHWQQALQLPIASHGQARHVESTLPNWWVLSVWANHKSLALPPAFSAPDILQLTPSARQIADTIDTIDGDAHLMLNKKHAGAGTDTQDTQRRTHTHTHAHTRTHLKPSLDVARGWSLAGKHVPLEGVQLLELVLLHLLLGIVVVAQSHRLRVAPAPPRAPPAGHAPAGSAAPEHRPAVPGVGDEESIVADESHDGARPSSRHRSKAELERRLDLVQVLPLYPQERLSQGALDLTSLRMMM